MAGLGCGIPGFSCIYGRLNFWWRRHEEAMVECGGESDGEDVGGYVLDGEEAAEEDFAGEGEAEGVNWGDGDEAAEFEQRGDEDGEGGEADWAESGEDRGKGPVEGGGPEDGAEVFVEEPV